VKAIGKRLFDLGLAILLLGPILVILVVLWIAMRIRGDSGPFIYASERMKSVDRAFVLYKVRSMSVAEGLIDRGVAGGYKGHRITPFGRFLRRSRLDELPQILNVLKGDMSFVGPRPPEQMYVEAYPDLYRKVLRDRPGITGLATVVFHTHEERILALCGTAEETDTVYKRRCIPRKAALDLLYHQRKGICLDLYIMYLTAAKLLPLPTRRVERFRTARLKRKQN